MAHHRWQTSGQDSEIADVKLASMSVKIEWGLKLKKPWKASIKY